MGQKVNKKEIKDKSAPTLFRDGKRKWIYPDRRVGLKSKSRKRIAIVLILIYLVLPFIKMNGLPLVGMNIETGIVSFFGHAFRFHNASYLVFIFILLAMVLFIVTALKGRIWCGYACPQTVWIDWVIRPIEEFLEGPAAKRQVNDKAKRSSRLVFIKTLKHLLYFIVASVLAHVFLAYFISTETLFQWITSSPLEHWKVFLMVTLTTLVLYLDFAWFREQFCAFLCPYARFQSVMMDEHTPVVTYNTKRGEERGKKASGDCIDCGLCQRVCPTGIDIRDGLQLECIQCFRCVDACNIVMASLKRPANLIDEISAADEESNSGETRKTAFLRPRILAYSTILLLVFAVFSFKLLYRKNIEVLVTRQVGTSYIKLDDGRIANLFQLNVVNTTSAIQNLKIESKVPGIELICSGCDTPLKKLERKSLSLLVASSNMDLEFAEFVLKPNDKVFKIKLIKPN